MIERQKAPCADCIERVIGCHSNCIKYTNWKQRQDILKQKIKQDKELRRIIQKSWKRNT